MKLTGRGRLFAGAGLADVAAALTEAATPDKITNVTGDTPNRLLYTGA